MNPGIISVKRMKKLFCRNSVRLDNYYFRIGIRNTAMLIFYVPNETLFILQFLKLVCFLCNLLYYSCRTLARKARNQLSPKILNDT